jgi:hypothetical protein
LILRRDHILKIWEKLCNINEVSTGDNIQEISVYLPGVKKKEVEKYCDGGVSQFFL